MDLHSFTQAKILVVGDLMLDRYLWGSVHRISPEAPVPIVSLDRTTVSPGGAANVAVNVAALGANVRLIGSIGADADAEVLAMSLEACGVDTAGFVKASDRSTSVKTRVIAHGQQIVRMDSESIRDLGPADRRQIFDKFDSVIDETDLVIVSDYGKGVVCEPVVASLIGRCRSADKPVLVDPKGKHYEKYSGASILTPNRKEAADACKLDEGTPDLVERAGTQLVSELDLEFVLITESENGMTLFDRSGNIDHFDAAARQVYDVTGAGDSVIACLGVAIAAGLSTLEAVRLSNVVGGLSIEKLGTSGVTLNELRASLSGEFAIK